MNSYMHITHYKERRHELGGGLESGDGGDYVKGFDEMVEQVVAKGG